MTLKEKINKIIIKLKNKKYISALINTTLINKNLILIAVTLLTTVIFGYTIIMPSSIKNINRPSLSYNAPAQIIPKLTQEPAQTPALSPTITNPPPSDTPSPSPTPSPTPTITPTPNPTANWRTYQNAQYGYKLMYPDDWTMRDFGTLEPRIPSYIIFNQNTASAGARSITIMSSTRTYAEQAVIEGTGYPENVANTTAYRHYFRDSNGQQSVAIIIPRTNNLLIIRSKTPYLSTFNQMLMTLNLF